MDIDTDKDIDIDIDIDRQTHSVTRLTKVIRWQHTASSGLFPCDEPMVLSMCVYICI